MKQAIRYSILLVVGLICLFFDILMMNKSALFHLSFSIALFYAFIAARAPFMLILCAGFLALLPPFIQRGSIGADLIIMIPLGLLLYYIESLVDLTVGYKVLLVLFAMVSHVVLIRMLL